MPTIHHHTIPAVGHINPVLPVLTELMCREVHVVAFNTDTQRERYAREGIPFEPYPNLPEAEALFENAAKGRFAENMVQLLSVTGKLLPFVLKAIERDQPDLIIFDSLATWGRVACAVSGVRGAAFVTTFLIEPRTMLRYVPARQFLRLSGQFATAMPQMRRVQRQLQREYHVGSELVSSPLMNIGQRNIVFTARELQPDAERYDEHFVFVGASIRDRGDQLDFTLSEVRPIIYISLGTVNNQNIGFYRLCLETFADHPGQFVMSVGHGTDPTALGAVPDNFVVRPAVAQLEILKHADVFISHGGMNSAHESLYYGVPLLFVPQQSEQMIVARRIEALGAGQVLAKVTATHLRSTLEHILERRASYQGAAQLLGDALRAAGGTMRAADELQTFMSLATVR